MMEHLTNPQFFRRIICAFLTTLNNIINKLAFVVENDSVLCEFLN
jgi:hypothetical protein